jgi:hypothetical protein
MNHDKIDRILNIAVLIGIVVLLVSLKISFDLQGKLHRQIEVLEAEKYIWKQLPRLTSPKPQALAPKHAVLTVTAFTNSPQETNEDIYTATATIPVVGGLWLCPMT